MSVPADTWPKGLLVNRSMVLTGLPPPAPRTLLDLYQVRLRVGVSGCSSVRGYVVGRGQGWGVKDGGDGAPFFPFMHNIIIIIIHQE